MLGECVVQLGAVVVEQEDVVPCEQETAGKTTAQTARTARDEET